MAANNAISLVYDPLPLLDTAGAYSLILFYVRGYWDGAVFTPDTTETPFNTTQIFGSGNALTGTTTVAGLIATAVTNIGTYESLTFNATQVNSPSVQAGTVWHT